MREYLREAIQRLLNEEGDGWSLTQFVVVMGLERLNSDGQVESLSWYWFPDDQPVWQSIGLLEQTTDDIRHGDYETDD